VDRLGEADSLGPSCNGVNVPGMHPHIYRTRLTILSAVLSLVCLGCTARDAKREEALEPTISLDTVKAAGSRLCLNSTAGFGLVLSSLQCGAGHCTVIEAVGGEPGPNRVGIYAMPVPKNSLDTALRLATLSMRIDTGRLELDMPTFYFQLDDSLIVRQLMHFPFPVWAERLSTWSAEMQERVVGKASAIWTDSLLLSSTGNSSKHSIRLKLESGTDVHKWLADKAELTIYGSAGPIAGDPLGSFESGSTEALPPSCVEALLSGKGCDAEIKTQLPWVRAQLKGAPDSTKSVDPTGCFEDGFELWTAWGKIPG